MQEEPTYYITIVSTYFKGGLTGGSSGWDCRPEDPLLGGKVDLDSGIATGVVDLAGHNLLDRHLGETLGIRVTTAQDL